MPKPDNSPAGRARRVRQRFANARKAMKSARDSKARGWDTAITQSLVEMARRENSAALALLRTPSVSTTTGDHPNE